MIADEFWLHVDKSGGPDHLKWETLHHAEGDGSSCWIWLRCKSSGGYGSIRVCGKSLMAHRYAWELENGPIPEGSVVGHYCDHLACVRPDHLYIGSRTDSAQYMVKKGNQTSQLYPERMPRGERHGSKTHPERVPRGERHSSKTHPERVPRGDRNGSRTHPERVPRGERNGSAKLTEEQVKEIRRLRQTGMTLQQLGIMFDVNGDYVNDVCKGETWKHVEGKVDLAQTYAPGEDFVVEHGIPNIQRRKRSVS
jgi:hypothetical protein